MVVEVEVIFLMVFLVSMLFIVFLLVFLMVFLGLHRYLFLGRLSIP